MKRVLLVAGTDTLGGPTYSELVKLGYSVDVISLEDFSSVTPRIIADERIVVGSKHGHLVRNLYPLCRKMLEEVKCPVVVRAEHGGGAPQLYGCRPP